MKKLVLFCILLILAQSVIAGTTTKNIETDGTLRGDSYYLLETINLGEKDNLLIKNSTGNLYSINVLIEDNFYNRTGKIFVKDEKTGLIENQVLEGWDLLLHNDDDFSFFDNKINFKARFLSTFGFFPSMEIIGLNVKREALQIQNQVPTALNVYISPNNPNENDNLVCNYTFVDFEGDQEADSLVRWFKGGSVIYSGKTLPKSYTKMEDVVYCSVLPEAKTGTVKGDESKSVEVLILKSLALPVGTKTGNVMVPFTDWITQLKGKTPNPIAEINKALTVKETGTDNIISTESSGENFIILKNVKVGSKYTLTITSIKAGDKTVRATSGTSDSIKEENLIGGGS